MFPVPYVQRCYILAEILPNYAILMRRYKADKRLAFSLGAKSLVPMNYPILDNSGHLWTSMLKFLLGFCNVTNCDYKALTGVTLKLLSNIVPPLNQYLHRNWMGHLRAGPTKGSLVAWDARKASRWQTGPEKPRQFGTGNVISSLR